MHIVVVGKFKIFHKYESIHMESYIRVVCGPIAVNLYGLYFLLQKVLLFNNKIERNITK